MENVSVTPSFTGPRLPDPTNLLRVARDTTGRSRVAMELFGRLARRQPVWASRKRFGRLFAVMLVFKGVAVLATLTIITSHNVWVPAYAQVLRSA